MKLGETITHNGITAVLVEGTDCKDCCFNDLNCGIDRLYLKCLARNIWDDDYGIFKKVEEKQK